MRPFFVESGPRAGVRSRPPVSRDHSKQKSGLVGPKTESIFSRKWKKFFPGHAKRALGPGRGHMALVTIESRRLTK